jgi:methylphosphotriester-DNA--protein-cysteine methyltransferase
VAIGLYAFSDYESVALLVDKALNFVKARRLKLVVNSAMSSLDTDPLYTEHVFKRRFDESPNINCSVSSWPIYYLMLFKL